MYEQRLADKQVCVDQLSEQAHQDRQEVLALKKELQIQQTHVQTFKDAWTKQRTQINHYVQWHTKLLYHTKKIHASVRPLRLECQHLKEDVQKEWLDLSQTIRPLVSSLAQQYNVQLQALMQAHETQRHSLRSEGEALHLQLDSLKHQLEALQRQHQHAATQQAALLDQTKQEFQHEKSQWTQQLAQRQQEFQSCIGILRIWHAKKRNATPFVKPCVPIKPTINPW